jgi:hypothetical protein
MKTCFFILILFIPILGIPQVRDDFSDGNFTDNPAWIGDTNQFEVNSSGQLHFHATGTDTSVLTTQNFLISDTEWDFWIKLSFNTSVNNYARVYLVADNPNLEGSLNGYFLRIGGNNDSIALVRQNGADEVTLIRAKTLFTGNSVNIFRFRVVHDTYGLWHLFSDNSGNSNFTEEGTSWDNSITTTSFFGVYCRFTSSNSTKFYFDDFYIGNVIVDTVAPAIMSVSIASQNSLTLKFSEVIDAAEGENRSNYFIRGTGNPLSVKIDSSDMRTVHLIFEDDFTEGSCDTLFVNNIPDVHGNTSGMMAVPFCFHTAGSFDIVISEIMADPTPQVGLPDAEYIELYNRSAFPVSLKDWVFEAGFARKILPEIILHASEYLTLTKGTLLGFFGPSIDLFSSSSTLTNNGMTLVLKNDKNQVIHSVTYSIDWYGNSLKDNGGWSLEMIDPENPCGCADNWGASVSSLGGTPGKINSISHNNPDTTRPGVKRATIENDSTIRIIFSEPLDSSTLMVPGQWILENENILVRGAEMISPGYDALDLHLSSTMETGVIYTLDVPEGVRDCSGNSIGPGKTIKFARPESVSAKDIIINEILPSPFPGGERFAELYNRSEKVLDLRDLVILDPDSISKGKTDPVSISEEGFLIFPGRYLVLTKDPADIRSRYKTPDPDCFIKMASVPGLTSDEEGTVILARKNDLEIIDRVPYSKDMNFPLLASPEGVSLERISPSGLSEDKSNWHSAAGSCGYATPGYINSQNLEPGPSEDIVIIEPAIFSPDNDGKNDVLLICIHLGGPGYVANVSVFSSTGRLVKQLTRNELLATEGFFSWDGITDQNTRADTGIYIIRIDLFAPEGIVKHFKKTAVLGSKF